MAPRTLVLRLGLAVVAILLITAVVLAGFAAYLHSGPGERMIAARVEDALSEPDRSVEIEALAVTWPFELSAREIRLSDRSGPWMRVREPIVDWSPNALLRSGAIEIERLGATEVVVHRPPEPGAPPPKGGAAFPLPDFVYRLNDISAPIVLEAPVAGERVELDLQGTFQMRSVGGQVDVRLRADDGAAARLSGAAGRDYVDLRWYLDVPALEHWELLAATPMAGRLAASGFIAGRLPSPTFSGPTISGTAEIGPGGVAGIEWRALEAELSLTPVDNAWGGNATLVLVDPIVENEAAPSTRIEAAFRLDPDAGSLHLDSSRLIAEGIEVSARGQVEEWGRRTDLNVAAKIPNLARLEPLIGIRLDGGGDARAHVTGDLIQPDLHASFQVDGRKFASGIGVLDRLLGAQPTASGRVHLGPDRQVLLSSAHIDGARAQAQLDGIVGATVDLAARLEIPDLSVFAETLTGSGVAEGRIFGGAGDFGTSGIGHFDRLAAAGSPPATGTAGFEFHDLTGTPMGRVTADMIMQGNIPLLGSARIVVGEAVRIEDLQVTSRGSRLAGQFAVIAGGVAGNLTASIPRLENWRSQLGEIAGGLEIQGQLDPAAGQSLRLTARGRQLAMGSGTRIADAELNTDISGIGTAPQGRVRVDARGMRQGDLVFDRVVATAQGDPSLFRFHAEGRGEQASLAAAGSAQIQGPRGLVALDHARLSGHGSNAELEGKTRVLWGPDGVIVEPAALAVDGGRIEGEGRAVRGTLSGRALLRAVPLDLVALVAPDVEAAGTVDGELIVGGTLRAPTARLSLSGRRLAFAAAAGAGLGRLDGRLDAAWANGQVQGTASLRDRDVLRVESSFTLPLRTEGDPMPDDAPIAGRLQVTGDVQRLSEALSLAGHVFQGRIDADLMIGGNVGSPSFSGQADIADGRYENFMQGTVITDLAADADFDLHSARIQARGTDGGAGAVRLDATLDLVPAIVGWRGSLGLDNFRLVRRDDIRGTVDADLTLAGQGYEGSLTGNARVTEAEIDIERLEGAGPVMIEVIEINPPRTPDDAAAPAPPAAGDGDPVSVQLGIDVDVERAFVRGRGLDSEWGGALRVTGTVAEPALAGSLSAQRGRFDFMSRVFRLDPESTVFFDPEAGLRPRLDVSATTRARDITARVGVTGTTSEPKIEITSDPSLPQEEVLSRVLFDSEAGQLSAFQQFQLGQMAAAGLGAPGAGFDPIGGLRGMLGLDVLEVGADDGPEGGPTIGVGRYIGEDTFLRLEQGTQGAGRVTVERELGRGFSVTTELGQAAGGGVGLEWRRDY